MSNYFFYSSPINSTSISMAGVADLPVNDLRSRYPGRFRAFVIAERRLVPLVRNFDVDFSLPSFFLLDHSCAIFCWKSQTSLLVEGI